MKQLAFFVLLSALCAWLGAPALGAKIVCTTTIVGDVVSRVAGDDLQAVVLLPPDTDPHAFEPRPQDLVALQGADLVFISGLGLEAGMSSILESIETPIISLSDGLPDLLSGVDAEGSTPRTSDGFDPHVWFDPTLVSSWVDGIADALSTLLPLLESGFRSRAADYKQELAALDGWIQEAVAAVPPDRRKLVTDHRVLGYFARRYGFEQVGTVIPGVSSLAEPSARDLADLVNTIETLGVPAIFVGTTINPSISEQIAADTGTRFVFLYTGALSAPDGPAATYVDFMHHDVAAIVDALGETP